MKTASKIYSFAKAVAARELTLDFELVNATIHNLTNSQLSSLMITEMDRVFPKARARGIPSLLQLEPTNVCNLRCPLCPSGRHELGRPTGMMSLDMYKRLMDEVGPGLSLMIFWGWGEPLLHPDAAEMIRIAKTYNTAVVTSTNGQNIDTDLAEGLVRSGLDILIVALDGAEEESYQSYRIGGTCARVIDAVRLVQQAKSRLGSKFPVINLRTVVTKDNEQDLSAIREIANQFKVDYWTLRSEAMSDMWEDADESLVPADRSQSMYRYENGKRVKTGSYVCRRPWKRATVAWDGSIMPCEMDFSNTRPYGVFGRDGSFRKIWNSPTAVEFRKAFLEDRMQFEFCARCPLNDRVTDECTIERVAVTA